MVKNWKVHQHDLGGATAWPLAARAQQAGEPVRRVGGLTSLAADDPEAPARVAAFAQGLGELGWSLARNVRIDYRWGAADTNLFRKYAAELVALRRTSSLPMAARSWEHCNS